MLDFLLVDFLVCFIIAYTENKHTHFLHNCCLIVKNRCNQMRLPYPDRPELTEAGFPCRMLTVRIRIDFTDYEEDS